MNRGAENQSRCFFFFFVFLITFHLDERGDTGAAAGPRCPLLAAPGGVPSPCQPTHPDPKPQTAPSTFRAAAWRWEPGNLGQAAPKCSSPRLPAALSRFLARKSLGITNLRVVHTHTLISTSLVGKRALRTTEVPGLRYSTGSGDDGAVDPKVLVFPLSQAIEQRGAGPGAKGSESSGASA